MPRTVSFPAPATGTCPICGTSLTRARCGTCGAHLDRPAGVEMWAVDHRLHRLVAHRNHLAEQVLAPAPPVAPPVPVATPGPSRSRPGPVPTPPPLMPPPGPRPTGAAAPRPGPSVAELLVGLGALSLVAAVVVFAAVAWDSLRAWAQGGLLVAATATVLGLALACRRRSLVATAESLGLVGVVLALADVQVARVGLDGLVPARTVWSVGLAAVAAGAWALGRSASLRGVAAAGVVLAFLPLAVVTAGAPSAAVLLWVLAAQALAGAVVVDRLGGDRLPRDPREPAVPTWQDRASAPQVRGWGNDRPARAAAVVGTVLSWLTTALGAPLLAIAGLVAVPARGPAGAAALVAALALGSVVVGRRHTDPVLAAAGTALGFGVGLVAVLGTHSPTPLLWVLAGQGLAGLAAARLRPEGPADHRVLAVGGSASAGLAALGATITALAEGLLAPGQVPAALPVVAVLAAGSLLIGWRRRDAALAAVGGVLATLVAPLAATATGSLTVLAWTLVGEAASAVVLGAVLRSWSGRVAPEEAAVLRSVEGTAHLALVGSGGGATVAALVLGLDALLAPTARPSVVAVAVVAALGLVAAAGARWAGWARDGEAAGLAVAVGAVLAATALASAHLGEPSATLVTAVGALLVVALAGAARTDGGRPWTAPLLVAGGTVVALAMVPLGAVASVVDALAQSWAPGRGTFAQPLADRLAQSTVPVDQLPSWGTALQLAALAVAAGALVVGHRRVAVALLAGIGVATLIALPVAAGLTVGATAVLLGVAVAGAGAVLVLRPDDPVGLAGGAALVALLVAVAASTTPLTVGATALVAVGLGVLAARSLQADRRGAGIWLAAGLLWAFAALVADVVLLGGGGSVPALWLVGAAALSAGIAPALERWRPGRTDAIVGSDLLVGAAAVVALLATESVAGATAVLAVIGTVAGASALRPRRRDLWVVSVAAAVALTWLQLATAEVDLLEAYTLPAAAGLLVVGLLLRKDVPRSSWLGTGCGLLLALGPSTTLAVTGADGATRTALVVVGGVAVTLWGAVGRQQAPLAIGGVAVGAVALRQLLPVAAGLPEYLVFATAGVVLLAAGATFEQRRRDLRTVADAFGRLR